MKILSLAQGTDEWLAVRGKYRTASEAPAMMGEGHISRSELLRMKATGDAKEYSRWVEEVLFPRGHEIQALAQPLAEEYIGEELYPVTGVCDDDYLLASFDGLTMDGATCWECKSWNAEKAQSVQERDIPDSDQWQIIHQLVVSGAERCVYTISDGTPEKTLHLVVSAADHQTAMASLVEHWHQFDADLATYTAVAVEPEIVGRSPDALPALRIEVQGKVLATNLDAFREHAMAVLAGINRDLQTDVDFANAEKTVKWCGDVETKLDLAKEQALSQTADIDQLFRTVDSVKAEARAVRLELEKLVKARKEAVRGEILAGGREALLDFIGDLNSGLSGAKLPDIKADFAGAMKGKKTITSLRDAVATELARAKVEASRIASGIAACMEIYRTESEGMNALFPDLHTLVLKAPDDFRLLVKSRVAERKAAEELKLESERARIRAEEAARAAARAGAEAEAAERARIVQETAERARRQAAEAAEKPPSAPQEAPRPVPAPEPEEVLPLAATATSSAPMARKQRPTDQQIIDVLKKHFSVHDSVVVGWLMEMDFSESAA